MPFGYIGQNQTKQKVKNTGVLSSFDISLLEKKGQAGGSLELIEEQTISSSTAQVDFTAIKQNVYDVHFLQFTELNFDTDNKDLRLRFGVGGTIDTDNDYQRARQIISTSGNAESRDNNISYLTIAGEVGSATNELLNGYIYIYNAGNSSKYTFTTHQTTQLNYLAQFQMNFGGGVYDQTAEVDTIRLYPSSGNWTAGTIKLYGVKQI